MKIVDLSFKKWYASQKAKRALYTIRRRIYLGTKIWNLVLVHLKDLRGPSTFKNQIKKWIAKVCPCRLCEVHVAHVGFLQKVLRSLLPFVESDIACFIHSVFVLFYFSLYISLFLLFFYLCYLSNVFIFIYAFLFYLFIFS